MVSIGETDKILIEATEDTKSYESIGRIIEKIVSKGFSKNNKLVAIGGGITQDVTSFAASILLRGVDWTFYPTNLASQCDSCIGSKTSVNLGSYKNQLGGFWPPREILIDFTFCKTLSALDICAGLGEMMHYFLVDGRDCIHKLSGEVKDAKINDHVLSKLVERSLLIKKAMVEIDEFDQGPRRVFNYGHTFGHALEAATNFAVPHGIAVAYGMDLANIISARLGLINIDLRNELRLILDEIWDICPIPLLKIDVFLAALMKDKKNVDGKLNAIMTRGLGDMYQTPIELTDEIKNLISDFFKLKLYEKNI
jgi:3-dehydroquinate synthase